MNTLKQKYYSYNTSEFLPIYQNGELINMREFHLYKMKRLALKLASAFDNAYKRRSTPVSA